MPPAPVHGSALWVWYAHQGGDWLSTAQAAGCSHVLVKAGDGGYAWPQFTPALVDAVHAAGLRCLAWTYVYLEDPAAEVAVGLQALGAGADGLALDIEYEAIGEDADARALVDGLRAGAPDAWLGYAPDLRIAFGNRWPTGPFAPDLEPFPWAWLDQLDGVLPQLYYTDFAQPPALTVALAQRWADGIAARGGRVPPCYPVLPCTSSPAALVAALDACRAAGYAGVSLWRWDWGNAPSLIPQLGAADWPPEDTMADPQLVSLLGYLRGDIADVLQAALDGARHPAGRTPADRQRAQREAFDSLQAALDTLRRGGPPDANG
ncbi:MAG TPA: hypothetical protein VK066_20695 [Chloroflexota bacterium]|nr:hypothetical protein [Chloroflexota bacterium]